ncbi:unnamed protein product, partial [Sphacelaria rigidula]
STKAWTNEVEVLEILSHPSIVDLVDTFKKNTGMPKLFIVMAYEAGGTLRELVNRSNGGLGEQHARALFRQLASGVCYLHQRRIIHRDIKLSNIVLDSNHENLKIIDFGLSAVMTTGRLQTPCGEYAGLFRRR